MTVEQVDNVLLEIEREAIRMDKTAAKLTKDQEVELWRRWKANPTNENLNPLIKSLNPIIELHVNKMHGNLPKSALKAQMTKLTIDSLDRYDPEKSQLNTFVYNNAGQKLHRYVYTYQNLGSIPEPRIIQIGTYKRIKSNMEQELGRPPTYDEIADEMKVPPKQLKLLDKELRQDLIQDINYINIFDSNTSEIDDSIIMLHAELYGTDREVMEYLYGLEGKPSLSNAEIATKLGISQSMVTQIKAKIANRLQKSGVLKGY